MKRSGMAAISLSRVVSSASAGGGCGDWSAANTPCAKFGAMRLQRRDEVGQKACEVAIPFVQRQPGHANPWFASLATGDPFADQRGLAKAGGCRDEREFAARQRGPRSAARSGGGGGQLLAGAGGYRASWLKLA